MLISGYSRQFSSAVLAALACCLAGPASAFDEASIANPIGKIARIFNSQLVKTEDRVSWLDNRIATFAQYREHAMKVSLGFRGCRADANAPDPTITLDLGSVLPIDTVFLVPTQREFAEDPGIFPKRFTIELSNDVDFKQRTVLYSSGSTPSISTNGNPVPFKGRDSARFVRLTVHQGHQKGLLDMFGLSEIAVISNRDSVSFNATVTTSGNDLNVPGIWYPASPDGRAHSSWRLAERQGTRHGIR